MLKITDAEIKRKIEFQNPWWDANAIYDDYRAWQPRAYLDLFFKLLSETKVQRAVVLMGPRRVGKTIMLYHTIQRLIDKGITSKDLIYISIDSPNYTDIPLERLLDIALGNRLKRELKGVFIFFDEIQYLKNWEIHLKKLVEEYPGVKFVASGSAAAALRMKSRESGAGRFTDFLLPPLTFNEFLTLSQKDYLVSKSKPVAEIDIGRLNAEFVNYLNYGGYPEAIFSPNIQSDPSRFIGSDIIDKVLLRDLPSLYGISDTQELNRLFTLLAYNTANEISIDELSKGSGVSKPTINRYIEYLEAAFLVKRLRRIDDKAHKFKHAVKFKIHLTNPSMRSALFGLVNENSEEMGNLTETAIYSQTLHDTFDYDWHYARWKDGEVDLVSLIGGRPRTCLEVKWSDRYVNNVGSLKSLLAFTRKNNIDRVLASTRTKWSKYEDKGLKIHFVPSSYICDRWGSVGMKNKLSSFSGEG